MKTKPIDQLLAERRSCYFIPPQHGEKGFIPALVIEGENGYHMMTGNGSCASPWYWGKTEREANEVADAQNAKRGIGKDDQTKIVISSMP